MRCFHNGSWLGFVRVLAVGALVLALDQVTKSWAVASLTRGPKHLFWTLDFSLHFNSGAAFSFGAGVTPVFLVFAMVAIVVVLVAAPKVKTLPLALFLGLILGGAIGNVSDRLFRNHDGAVVDFIDFNWWPVFNVADVAIVVGCLGFAVFSQLRKGSAHG